MAQFSGNAQRLDPYKNFKLRLREGDRTYFGGKLTGLVLSPEVVQHRAGGDPSTSHKSPGRNEYNSITLNRGISQDQAFSTWASQVWNYRSSLGSEVSLANFRKDIYLEFYNEAGQLAIAYRIFGLNVSETHVLPPGGVLQHFLHPSGHGSIQEQLAEIFESSLRRLRP